MLHVTEVLYVRENSQHIYSEMLVYSTGLTCTQYSTSFILYLVPHGSQKVSDNTTTERILKDTVLVLVGILLRSCSSEHSYPICTLMRKRLPDEQ